MCALKISGKRVKVNGLWCAAAGVCTCSAACKVQKMSPAERLGGSWWEGVGGARKKPKQTTEQPAACEGSSGTRSRRTASHYLLFRRAVAVAFSSQGKLAHIDRKHLTTLAQSLVFFFSPAAAASAFTAFTLTFIVVFARVFSPTVYFGQSLGC